MFWVLNQRSISRSRTVLARAWYTSKVRAVNWSWATEYIIRWAKPSMIPGTSSRPGAGWGMFRMPIAIVGYVLYPYEIAQAYPFARTLPNLIGARAGYFTV